MRREEVALPGIVIGYDGTDAARRALDRAAAIAGGRAVTVVSVLTRPTARRRPDESVRDQVRRSREARDLLFERGITARTVDGFGDVASALVGEAVEQRADLLIVGSNGKGFFERLALGSVSNDVVQRAPCDVMVVR